MTDLLGYRRRHRKNNPCLCVAGEDYRAAAYAGVENRLERVDRRAGLVDKTVFALPLAAVLQDDAPIVLNHNAADRTRHLFAAAYGQIRPISEASAILYRTLELRRKVQDPRRGLVELPEPA